MERKLLAKLSKNIFHQLKDHEFKIIKYFQNDLGRYLLLFKIMESYFAEYSLSQERILESIPSCISSRSSLLNAINNLISKKYIKKEPDPDNKRAKLIIPEEDLVNEYKAWVKLIHKE